MAGIHHHWGCKPYGEIHALQDRLVRLRAEGTVENLLLTGEHDEYCPADELRAMYEAAGVTPDKEVVTYCQGGYRAAHGYLALRLLGYPRVRNYTGSWKEWGDREDLPIENK